MYSPNLFLQETTHGVCQIGCPYFQSFMNNHAVSDAHRQIVVHTALFALSCAAMRAHLMMLVCLKSLRDQSCVCVCGFVDVVTAPESVGLEL